MLINRSKADKFFRIAACPPLPEDQLSEAHYQEFLNAKIIDIPPNGIVIAPSDVHPVLKPHQRDGVVWGLHGGRRALFLLFGLGKSLIQLEIGRQLVNRLGGRFLIVCPLGVRQEFVRDGKLLGLDVRFVRSLSECGETGVYLTNYETVREGKINPKDFIGASLDEAAILRGFGGVKTYREFMRMFEGMKFKFVATATPSPNELIELLAYSAFLEIADVSQIKTRYFKRDSVKADNLTLHPHKKREFWLWCASWGLFVTKPSDLGYDDTGYDLPKMEVYWHEVHSDHAAAGEEVSGQLRLLKTHAIGLADSAREKRASMGTRIAKLVELRQLDPGAHRIIWHDLEDERRAVAAAIPGVVSVYGNQDLDEREQAVIAFSEGRIQELSTKPSICGSGPNFQYHCAWAIFLGIGFKFNEFIQAVHRCYRFLQTKTVRLDLIYTEAEVKVRETLERKWEQHKELMAEMQAIIKEFGLAQESMRQALGRSMGVERIEARGQGWQSIHADAVIAARHVPDNSIDLVLTSIPFATQYEYSPNFADMGHTDSNEHFWQGMNFLTPFLLRALKPGRIAAIHVKDRIIPSGVAGRGFQEVYPFHVDALLHFTAHGFGFLGMKTIVTDVVRENNQTYRLGWTEQCKDGTKMGVGMPEYLLIFRKPPTETDNSYADDPVLKGKPPCVTEDGEVVPFDRNLPIAFPVQRGHYSRMRWQVDAHGYARSSGKRLLTPDEIRNLKHDQIFQLFKKYSLENVYDYEHHVKLGESIEAEMRLPVTFMLMQPQSWSDEVWADVTRMMTLNSSQSQRKLENHLCPMQFDIADRAITQFTNPGELVLDPFAGIGSVGYRALLMNRKFLGFELSRSYWQDGLSYLRMAEEKMNTPTLFDLLEDANAESVA